MLRTVYKIFYIYFPKACTYFFVCLIDGAARIFSNSYAAIGN